VNILAEREKRADVGEKEEGRVQMPRWFLRKRTAFAGSGSKSQQHNRRKEGNRLSKKKPEEEKKKSRRETDARNESARCQGETRATPFCKKGLIERYTKEPH